MVIDGQVCSGCGECLPYCPVSAILSDEATGLSRIDRDLCVECGACLRARVCPTGALRQEELSWPRSVRAFYSDPQTTHKHTNLPGRGTEEMKTNDVTGRIPPGAVGLTIEIGRPLAGTTFRDIQEVTQACVSVGCQFEPNNPLTALMDDPQRGTFQPDILEERMLSVVVELTIPQEKLLDLLAALKRVERSLRTVFSLGLSQVAGPDGKIPAARVLKANGYTIRPNGKTNIGLGRRTVPPCVRGRKD